MRTRLLYILFFIQLLRAHTELILKHLTEGESLDLSCAPQQVQGHLTGLHLYHRSSQSQTTLLSLSLDGKVRTDPERRARLQLCGGLNSPRINVTVSGLQPSDSGVYVWELSYREQNNEDQIIRTTQTLFLLVEVAGGPCRCSHSYHPLLLTISTAAGILLLMLTWMTINKCVKTRHHHRPQPHSPIYEEMSRKQQQQSPGSPQNSHEAPAQPEEAGLPVYANPNIRQLQDNYYACPRQLALRA